MTEQDTKDFIGYLANCTDSQVRGVFAKEAQAHRFDYAALAVLEAKARGFYIGRNDY